MSFFFKKSNLLPFVEIRGASHSNACYHTHSHDEFSFGVIDAGEANYRNLGRKLHIHKGSTVTINPGDAHSCNPKAGNWSYRMLFVDTNWIGKLQQEMFNSYSQDYLPFAQPYENNMLTFQLFNELFESLINGSNALIAEEKLIQFIEQCYNINKGNINKGIQGLNSRQKIDTNKITIVKELILDQLDCNLTLDEFSQHTGLSRYHLIRSFKQTYGQSPHAFQLDQRIQKSKSLLQQGNSISDTANLLGFADQSHFQRNFKKRIAVTPGQYQAFFI